MSNAEEGIAKIQAATARAQGAAGLKKHHDGNITYLNERILVFFMAFGLIGLMVLWATATSPLVLYGSLAGVIMLTILWGIARARRLQALKRQRARQAESWQSREQT